MGKFKILRLLTISCVTVSLLMAAGCSKQHNKNTDPDRNGKVENKFDYSTTADIKVAIDYSIKGNKALFEIYDENPVTYVDGAAVKKEGVNALLKAYTDKNSRYYGVIDLPTAVEKVYLYSESYGLPTCIPVEVTLAGISFNFKDYVEGFRANTAGKNGPVAYGAPSASNPYNIQTLGSWDYTGAPQYVTGEWHNQHFFPTYVEPLPDGLYNRIQNVLLPNSDNSALAKPTEIVNINVTASAKLTLVFMNELAAYRNAIGYYYYETGNPPKTQADLDKLPKYIAFPNCSKFNDDPYGDSGIVGSYMPPLWPGEQLELIYYPDNGLPTTVFPKETTIGWFILPDGFEVSAKGEGRLNITGSKHGIRYSNNEFNEGEARYCVSVYDTPSKKTIIGFEDSGDNDYKDVLFYVDATPDEAVFDPNRPTTDPDEQYPDIVGDPIEGTLAFEDLWPSQGDYDMNDVIVGYSTTFTTDKNNRIVTIKDVFTPLHNGSQLACAFGYQLEMEAANIKSVKIKNGSSSAYTVNGLEAKQNKPTIMLFDNIRDAVKNGPITVTIEVTGDVPMEKVTRKNLYNPFICVNSKEFFPGQLRKEVHLTNYAPTAIADLKFFGINDDKSPVDKNKMPTGPYYYVTSELYPFALDLPITDYVVPTERVEMNKFYPEFSAWVKSDGKDHKEWYLKPAK